MPIVTSRYRAPVMPRGGHAQTVWAAVVRRVPRLALRRERIATPDGDFLDLDHLDPEGPCRGVAILSHGLEGHSRRRYMLGMARALARRGWAVVAWNMRGCSGEPNRLLRSYHSGASDDLGVVVDHVMATWRHGPVALVGFSLGGNITLKFAAEPGEKARERIARVVAFSVPCDLASSAARLARWDNRLYMHRFLRTLVHSVQEKAARFPGRLDLAGIERMRTFAEFDERFTAPIHGFAGAQDYWRRCSSRPMLPRIQIPTLIVNARDDPFLTPECFPVVEATASACVHLEMPARGGHVGFVSFAGDGEYWSEVRAVEFLSDA